MNETLKIGWIGLGKMGVPMSKNLIRAGYPVTAYDIIEESYKPLQDEAKGFARSPMSLAADSDVIFSMIPDDGALKDVALGPMGLCQGAREGTIFVDMSTVSPVASSEVADDANRRGILYLRAPVSGSTLFAQTGKLTILASGQKEAYDRCLELFKVMGEKVIYVGSGEESRYLKLLLNMMVATTSIMIGEALAFGELGGMDWKQMIDVINNSAVAAPQIGFKAQILKDRDFTPAFTTAQMAKDLDIALDTGKAVSAHMPITSMVRQYLTMMMAQGKGNMDFFGLVTLMEKMAGR
ncbi:MAG: NAD(P)-dependent oxidoreductase [Desulfatiglandaceae bacterium]